jgi:RNA-directed DNA polymerase
MRKSKTKRQQKNEAGLQLKLFSGQAGELPETPSGGTGNGVMSRVAMLSLLERQRTLTTNLMERIVDYGNLSRACKQVVSNKGSSGIDGMETQELRPWLGKHLTTLQESLLAEEYEVSPVLKVEIDKPDGGKRMLGIPTVIDRLIQQAIQQELSRYYDPIFSESSHGFRPGRSAHQAIRQASKYVREGKEWVVDIDLEKFFDKINHDRLMQRLSKGIGDKRLLRLIRAYLNAGMMNEGLIEQRTAGTPQGGPLSPLLSNIVLDELDKEMEKRGHSFCRYADDCNIYVRSKKAGERVMASVTDFIETKLKLKVNHAKSGIRHCSEAKFLGFTLLPEGGIRIADKSIDRLKDKVRKITRRNRGVSFAAVIKELNSTIIGWCNYFRIANKWVGKLKAIDGWIRRKLRCFRLKQCKRRYSIFQFLRSFDFPERKCWSAVSFSQGWWNMSRKPIVEHAMNPSWFARQGLHSLYLSMLV